MSIIKDIELAPNPWNGINNPKNDPTTLAAMYADGFRIMPEQPAVPDGYTRQSIIMVEGDGINGSWEVVDKSNAVIQAEQDAINALAIQANNQRFIDSGLIPLASLYRSTLNTYFGTDAHKNHAVTMKVVVAYFMGKYAQGTLTQADGDARDMLSFGFQQLTAFSATDNTWDESIPWSVVP